MKNLKNIDWWEKVLEDTPASYKYWFEKEKIFLRENITEDSKVLEIGCGGRSLSYILDITKNIVGIDNNIKAVEDAKINLGKVDIRLADGIDLPFEDNSFDFVICMTTPANFGKEKQKFYSEMKRVMKQEGQILLSVFNEDALDERLKLYEKVGAKIRKNNNGKIIFEEDILDNVSEQFSKKELEEIFNEAGLKIIEIKKEGLGYFCSLRK